MTGAHGLTRTCCGARHPEPPVNCTAEAPAVWDQSFAGADDRLLTPDQCVVRGQPSFVKGLIEIPVIGGDDVFSDVPDPRPPGRGHPMISAGETRSCATSP
ncbi:DUF2199 domain-containing protein [Streptomyces tricolor]|uniref:DUF2199 domain-containing protein n=1 Tax=Streptomyces tricolor TaxID=68277 RepID=UPI0037FA4F92